jgi:hypothetical protein
MSEIKLLFACSGAGSAGRHWCPRKEWNDLAMWFPKVHLGLLCEFWMNDEKQLKNQHFE